ncbi:hypothetical protein ACFYVL_41590 [Streptomyces sp. NPDC004111]|uniref:hypothetical protein n=1 Tax=Streptomyces sp. NPDC004111 TaxID=3364690 RepID=UPI0036743D32
MTPHESLRTATMILVSPEQPATVLASGAAHVLCGALLGASVTAVALGLAGWGPVRGRTGGEEL